MLTTGDEIVEVDAEAGPTQIRNSNRYSLAVQIQQAGGEPVLLPIAPDEPRRLRQLIEQGLQSDLLLMTGGVSMGRYDLVEQVLAELRCRILLHRSEHPAWPSGSFRPRLRVARAFLPARLQPQSRTNISSACPEIRSRPWSPSNFSLAPCSKRWPDCHHVRSHFSTLI